MISLQTQTDMIALRTTTVQSGHREPFLAPGYVGRPKTGEKTLPETVSVYSFRNCDVRICLAEEQHRRE